MRSRSRVPREHWSQCMLPQPVVAQGLHRHHTAGRTSKGPGSARGGAGLAGGGWGCWFRAEKLSVCFPHSCCQVSCPLPHQGSRSPQCWAISISQASTPPPVPGQRGRSSSCPLNKRGSTRLRGGPWQRLGGAAACGQVGRGLVLQGPRTGGRWLSWGSEEG